MTSLQNKSKQTESELNTSNQEAVRLKAENSKLSEAAKKHDEIVRKLEAEISNMKSLEQQHNYQTVKSDKGMNLNINIAHIEELEVKYKKLEQTHETLKSDFDRVKDENKQLKLDKQGKEHQINQLNDKLRLTEITLESQSKIYNVSHLMIV